MVLVTGSTGLIGSRVCDELGRDHAVVGLDRDPPESESGGPDLWLECDLTDDASVEAALARLRSRCGARVASVVHLAAYYDFSGEPSPLYDRLTVQGTRRLLRGLRGFRVDQFVFSSSLLVMRPAEDGAVLDESSPVEAEWAYPRSKLDAEQVIREERGRIPAVILRIAGVYDEDCHSIPLGQQIRRIYEKRLESHFFPGDPDHGQSFVHLDDLATCFRAAVERRRELSGLETILVGEPEVVGYGEMQDVLGVAIHGKRWTTIRIPAPLAKAGAWVQLKSPGRDPFIKPWMVDLADARFPISIDRAREALGWTPERRLRDVLPEMAARLVRDPEAWYRRNGIEPPEDLELRPRRPREVSRAR